jgi:hypothetical protein
MKENEIENLTRKQKRILKNYIEHGGKIENIIIEETLDKVNVSNKQLDKTAHDAINACLRERLPNGRIRDVEFIK